LRKLSRKWEKQVSKHKVVSRVNGKKYPGGTYFAEDEFFPNYFNSEIKVLFIGWEPRYIYSENHIAITYEKLEKGNTDEDVLKTTLYIAHGIKHGCKMLFEDIPNHDVIGKKYVETNEFNFAIMEISKYANENDDGYNADMKLINSFLEHSELEKYNFIQEELSILDTDVIITMNLWDEARKIKDKFLKLALGDEPVFDGNDPFVCIRRIKINNKYIPLLDTYHFSAWSGKKTA
jgi:hypothetical protein